MFYIKGHPINFRIRPHKPPATTTDGERKSFEVLKGIFQRAAVPQHAFSALRMLLAR
jgi:hypothetical protein